MHFITLKNMIQKDWSWLLHPYVHMYNLTCLTNSYHQMVSRWNNDFMIDLQVSLSTTDQMGEVCNITHKWNCMQQLDCDLKFVTGWLLLVLFGPAWSCTAVYFRFWKQIVRSGRQYCKHAIINTESPKLCYNHTQVCDALFISFHSCHHPASLIYLCLNLTLIIHSFKQKKQQILFDKSPTHTAHSHPPHNINYKWCLHDKGRYTHLWYSLRTFYHSFAYMLHLMV